MMSHQIAASSKLSGVLFGSMLVLGLSGCVQGRSTLDEIQAAMGKSSYVEAFVEYPGPSDRWAGPASFSMHLTARDPQAPAQLTVSPPLWKARGVSVSSPRVLGFEKSVDADGAARMPAASASLAPHTNGAVPAAPATQAVGTVPSELARDEMARLANALDAGGEEPLQGCLTPVHVRLVHSDNSVTEKRACRSQAGWAHGASDFVNHIMTAWLTPDQLRRAAVAASSLSSSGSSSGSPSGTSSGQELSSDGSSMAGVATGAQAAAPIVSSEGGAGANTDRAPASAPAATEPNKNAQ